MVNTVLYKTVSKFYHTRLNKAIQTNATCGFLFGLTIGAFNVLIGRVISFTFLFLIINCK